MELKLEPVAKDHRGQTWRIIFPDNREAMVIFTKKGFYRGGHSHSKSEISLLLMGAVKTWRIVHGEEIVAEKSAGQFMINEADEPHLTLALEDYWLLDWKIDARIGEWTTTTYEPYRVRVRHQLFSPNTEETADSEGTKRTKPSLI